MYESVGERHPVVIAISSTPHPRGLSLMRRACGSCAASVGSRGDSPGEGEGEGEGTGL